MARGSAKKKLQYVILISVILIGGYAIGRSFITPVTKVEAGSRPPEFSLPDTNGNVHSLSDYEDRALVINFWGTFCPPCVKEMPEFQRQAEKWKDEPFDIIAINLSEDRLTVNNFLKRFDLEYTILLDRDRKVERSYKLRSYPTTFFVRPDGTIMEAYVGGMTEEEIDLRVRKLLGKN